MQSILILGGTGFMGRALCAHLRAEGHEVAAPSRGDYALNDVASIKRLIEATAPNTLINLAGISSVTHADDRALYDVNAFGHLNVLDATLAAAPNARVLLASTANVYGQSANETFRESDLPAPVNHYAISKLTAEQFNRLYSDRLQVSAVRPFNCTGRGQKPSLVISKLVDAFRRKVDRLELGDLSVRRDYVDIRDVCEMWSALIAAPAPPPLVNFGTGEATPLGDVIDKLSELSGHRLEAVSSPHFLRPRDIVYQRADTTILESLGFRRQFRLTDTLSWMLTDDGAHA